MANQISKKAILEHLNERIEEHSNLTFTNKGKHYQLNEAVRSAYGSLWVLIHHGFFDEKEITQ